MNYTYLLIDFALLLIAVFLSFGVQSRQPGNWKFTVPAAVAAALFCALLSFVFGSAGVLTFHAKYLSGIRIGTLPLEEWLFCLFMPYTGLVLYTYLNLKFPGLALEKFSLTLSNLLLGLLVAVVFFSYKAGNLYAIGIHVMLFLLLVYIEYINKLRFMYRFYRMFLLCFLLFYPVYRLLTGMPVYLSAYSMIVLLLAVYLYELFSRRSRV